MDNESAVIIYLWRTAKRLGIKEIQLSTPAMHLRAYDNSKRLVLGTILLRINVGPIEKKMEFVVLDITTTFNLLLGRQWHHEHQAVPSTPH